MVLLIGLPIGHIGESCDMWEIAVTAGEGCILGRPVPVDQAFGRTMSEHSPDPLRVQGFPARYDGARVSTMPGASLAS